MRRYLIVVLVSAPAVALLLYQPDAVGGITWICIKLAALVIAVIGAVLLAGMSLLWIHELGHVAAGYLVGLRLSYFQVGADSWMTFRQRLVYREVKKQWFRGFVVMVPKSGRMERWRYIVHMLGGPAANALVAGVLLMAAILYASPDSISRGLLAILALALGAMSFASLVPYRDQGIPSDGANLLRALRDFPSVQRGYALQRLHEQTRNLEPADQWSEDDMELVLSDPNDPESYPFGLSLRLFQLLSDGRDDEAPALVQKMLDTTPATSVWFTTVRAYAAYVFAWIMKDEGRASDSLTLALIGGSNSILQRLAESGTRFVQGRYEAAASIAEDALEKATEEPGPWQAYPQEVDRLRQIVSASRERLAVAATPAAL